MMRQGVRALHSRLLQRLQVVRVQSDLDGALAMMPWRGGRRRRMFSAEVYAPGTYLDRRDVVERVLHVVKTNPKVDPAKVPHKLFHFAEILFSLFLSLCGCRALNQPF